MDTNYALHLDLYQLNMAYVYFMENKHKSQATFEVYFRNNPFNNGHCVYVGTQKLVDAIFNFRFSDEDINYIKTLNNYSEEFLNYLKDFRFTGTIYAPHEGEVIFANEPILVIQAPLIEAQLIETVVLNIVNYQVLVATKASKIRQVTDKPLYEFGARRGYETEASLWGARASIISGFDGTSLVKAGKEFNIPVIGTHAHSYVQSYDCEYDAFLQYAQHHDNITFLVDTYDVINSGIPNALKAISSSDKKLDAIRIDSGDLAQLSKASRKLLDKHGFNDVKIIVSNDLDENTIVELQKQNAPIDAYGIGTKLVSCDGSSSLGAVYKLVNIVDNGVSKDVIKLSNTKAKITTPGVKTVYRLYDNNGYAIADVIAPFNMNFADNIDLYNDNFVLNHENYSFSQVRQLLQPIILDGNKNNIETNVDNLKQYNKKMLDEFDERFLRHAKPEIYPICLNQDIYNLKMKLIAEKGK